jgi:hypothetical protein
MGLMIKREAYKGYIIQSDPIPCGGRWSARVVIRTYGTREEADRASMAFGKALLDSRHSGGSS